MNLFLESLQHYFSTEEITKIQSQKIGIGGAGGLGGNLAIILARCGFCHFEIIDHDYVEAANLNRQPYTINDIGLPKIDALKKHLQAINPDLQLMTHQTCWRVDNAKIFFRDCTVIAECFDDAGTKCAFIEYYQDKVNSILSGNGLAGYGIPDPIKIQKIQNLYVIGDQVSDVRFSDPLFPRVLSCAAKMADIILTRTLDPL